MYAFLIMYDGRGIIMNEKLIVLLDEIDKNEKLQEEIKVAKDFDTLYAVTTKYVDGYTKEELK